MQTEVGESSPSEAFQIFEVVSASGAAVKAANDTHPLFYILNPAKTRYNLVGSDNLPALHWQPLSFDAKRVKSVTFNEQRLLITCSSVWPNFSIKMRTPEATDKFLRNLGENTSCRFEPVAEYVMRLFDLLFVLSWRELC